MAEERTPMAVLSVFPAKGVPGLVAIESRLEKLLSSLTRSVSAVPNRSSSGPRSFKNRVDSM